MPIYNTEPYLSDAIDSIINQSIGFEENIQPIHVDDGSLDRSGDISIQYMENYPNNIEYYRKKHEGPSTAKSFGLE